MFKFREISTDSRTEPGIRIFREITTDCLFVSSREGSIAGKYTGGLTQMLDPQTGKPLTYTNWKEKYNK